MSRESFEGNEHGAFANAAPHVHFPADHQIDEHDSEIGAEFVVGEGNTINVHLGFLQIFHRYLITFLIKDNYGDDLTFDLDQNQNAIIKEVLSQDEGNAHELVVEFIATKEKLLTEEIMLSTHSGKKLAIIFHARVLGKDKGKPALKRGIKCLGVEEQAAECSDAAHGVTAWHNVTA